MDTRLSDLEARVLGCLIEKSLTTPEYYPLTLNSLTAACNQKSNRSPIMSVQDTEVVRALERLRTLHLVWETQVAGSRVPKYEHNIHTRWNLQPRDVALLCVLLLRGPQTAGEIRARTGRMFAFEDLEDVEETLRNLESCDGGPFVVELGHLPGRRESRFMHLLCGEPNLESLQLKLPREPAVLQVQAENERITSLEESVQSLQDQVSELRRDFQAFKSQFE